MYKRQHTVVMTNKKLLTFDFSFRSWTKDDDFRPKHINSRKWCTWPCQKYQTL